METKNKSLIIKSGKPPDEELLIWTEPNQNQMSCHVNYPETAIIEMPQPSVYDDALQLVKSDETTELDRTGTRQVHGGIQQERGGPCQWIQDLWEKYVEDCEWPQWCGWAALGVALYAIIHGLIAVILTAFLGIRIKKLKEWMDVIEGLNKNKEEHFDDWKVQGVLRNEKLLRWCYPSSLYPCYCLQQSVLCNMCVCRCNKHVNDTVYVNNTENSIYACIPCKGRQKRHTFYSDFDATCCNVNLADLAICKWCCGHEVNESALHHLYSYELVKSLLAQLTGPPKTMAERIEKERGIETINPEFYNSLMYEKHLYHNTEKFEKLLEKHNVGYANDEQKKIRIDNNNPIKYDNFVILPTVPYDRYFKQSMKEEPKRRLLKRKPFYFDKALQGMGDPFLVRWREWNPHRERFVDDLRAMVKRINSFWLLTRIAEDATLKEINDTLHLLGCKGEFDLTLKSLDDWSRINPRFPIQKLERFQSNLKKLAKQALDRGYFPEDPGRIIDAALIAEAVASLHEIYNNNQQTFDQQKLSCGTLLGEDIESVSVGNKKLNNVVVSTFIFELVRDKGTISEMRKIKEWCTNLFQEDYVDEIFDGLFHHIDLGNKAEADWRGYFKGARIHYHPMDDNSYIGTCSPQMLLELFHCAIIYYVCLNPNSKFKGPQGYEEVTDDEKKDLLIELLVAPLQMNNNVWGQSEVRQDYFSYYHRQFGKYKVEGKTALPARLRGVFDIILKVNKDRWEPKK